MVGYEFRIEVTVHVSPDEDDTISEATCGRAALEAIDNAVERGAANGFEHPMADQVSIEVIYVRLNEPVL